MKDIFEYLKVHSVSYECYEHPPVYTCDEVTKYIPDVEGHRTKNLLLRDQKKKNYILLLCGDLKQVDLRGLGEATGLGRLSFASADDLQNLLGIEAGAVSVLGLINDTEKKVRLLIDKELWDGVAFQCHPLVNTATLVISQSDLEKFLASVEHPFELIDVPGH